MRANRAQIIRAGFDERFECGFASGKIRFSIKGDFLHVIERAAIAEEDAEVADDWRFGGGDDLIPVRGLWSLADAFEGIAHAFENRFGGVEREKLIQGLWLGCELAGDPTRHFGPRTVFRDLEQ